MIVAPIPSSVVRADTIRLTGIHRLTAAIASVDMKLLTMALSIVIFN